MNFGFVLPHTWGLDEPEDVIDLAVRAEELGFDGLFMAGSQTNIYVYGLPDIGLIGMREMIENGAEQLSLGAEVAMDQPVVHAGARSDLSNRDVGSPGLDEHLNRGLDQCRAHLVSATWLARNVGICSH